ncbi:MFS transporter [Taklimakanibacter lacteus]|uniref:MFS transporter n=1 Tax=Taklimakanibacter lacteus TaxID=2268456 RepID=UPI000E66A8F8
MPDRISSLAPLRHPVFRAVWTASFVSNLGSLIQNVGAAWLMTAISSSVDMVALVQASLALPIMLFSLPSGAIADNFGRRKVMLVAQGFMLVVSVLLAVSAYLGMLTPWLLLAFTFLLGCGNALNNPSWQAAVGDMVPRSDIPGAVTLNSMNYNLCRSVGPALGGIIVAAAGAVTAFAINAASYVALIVVLSRWRPAATADRLPRESMGTAMAAGLRYLAMSPNIRRVQFRAAVFGFATIASVALLPLIARDLLQGDALLYGLLFGAFGMGAVGGALSSARLRNLFSNENCVRLGFLGFVICLATAAISSSPWLTGAALMLGGASWVVTLSLFNITLQLSTPRWVVGRVLSLYQTATFGGMALGSWVWGLIAEERGSDNALLWASGVALLGVLMGLRWFAMPDQRELNLDPLGRWREPSLALDLKPRSGPIRITVEYIIRPEDTRDFLDAMAERRRIRRRDGARHWALFRDVENPELWTEMYNVPTWVDYVRLAQRVTFADDAVGEKIRRLHKGAGPPRAHRLIERTTARSDFDVPPKELINP